MYDKVLTNRGILFGLIVLAQPISHCAGQNAAVAADKVTVSYSESGQPVPRYRYYLGVEYGAQVFLVTSTTYPIQEAIVKPLNGFVGYQASPHATLQIGFSQRNPPREENLVVSSNQARQTIVSTSYRDEYDGALSFLLRYDVARHPTHRVFLNVLAGTTLLFHYYQLDNLVTADGQVMYETHDYAKTRNWYLTGGLSAGYRLTPNLDLLLQATANRNLSAPDYAAGARKTNFGFGVGLRYGFNIGKPR